MTEVKNEKKSRKILSIVLNVLTYVFFVICLLGLILSISAKKDSDGAISIFGSQMRIVVTNSMEKCPQTDVSSYKIKSIPVNSMVFIELVPKDETAADKWYSSLKKGDVLTFKYVYTTQVTITHRITEITEKESGGYIIKLEGDNKSSDSNTLSQIIDTSNENSPNYVIGKVTGQSKLLGALTTVIKNPIGIICIVIIPCAIIAIFEIFRLVSALTENKRKHEREEKDKRDEEFAEMKRQLELLKEQQAKSNAAQPNEIGNSEVASEEAED